MTLHHAHPNPNPRRPQPTITATAEAFADDLIAGIKHYLQHTLTRNTASADNPPQIVFDTHDEHLLRSAIIIAIANHQHTLDDDLGYPHDTRAVGLALLAMIRGISTSHYVSYGTYYFASDIVKTLPRLNDATFLLVTASVATRQTAYAVLDEIPRTELQHVLTSTTADAAHDL